MVFFKAQSPALLRVYLTLFLKAKYKSIKI
jgi:hypothetical protein